MYVRNFMLTDFRAFRRVCVDLNYPGRQRADGMREFARWPMRLPNVTVFLGMNGAGKSTLLDGLALALLSPVVASSGYRPQNLIRRSNKGVLKNSTLEAELILHGEDEELPQTSRARFKAHIERRGEIEFLHEAVGLAIPPVYYEDSGPSFFFVGYGASRRTEASSASDLATRRRARGIRYDRVASMFEDHLATIPLEAWLPMEGVKVQREVGTLLDRLLPAGLNFVGRLEDGEYLFRHRGLELPHSALSDGFKVYIGWIGDLMHHLTLSNRAGKPLDERRGVVLVDEIDLHIHPSWQKKVIPNLARVLRNIQFIFTTHSPLIVGTLERSNLYTVVSSGTSSPRVSRPDEETFGLSADQILVSEVFGLNSTRDPEFGRHLTQLRKKAERGEPGAALEFMRASSIGAGAEPDDGPPPEWLKKFSIEM